MMQDIAFNADVQSDLLLVITPLARMGRSRNYVVPFGTYQLSQSEHLPGPATAPKKDLNIELHQSPSSIKALHSWVAGLRRLPYSRLEDPTLQLGLKRNAKQPRNSMDKGPKQRLNMGDNVMGDAIANSQEQHAPPGFNKRPRKFANGESDSDDEEERYDDEDEDDVSELVYRSEDNPGQTGGGWQGQRL
jgi:hypothetical protein